MKHAILATILVAVAAAAAPNAAPAVGEKSGVVTIRASVDVVEPGETLQLNVDGLTLEDARRSKATFFPRERVTCFPASTWDGEQVIFFSARIPGQYLVGVYSPGSDGKVRSVERVVTVQGKMPDPTPPAPDPAPVPKAGKVWLIVVGDSLSRTQDEERTEAALRVYADANQDGRWRRLDRKSVGRRGASGEDAVPDEYARFVAASPAGQQTLFVVSEATGETLWTGKLPSESEAISIAKKYGG